MDRLFDDSPLLSAVLVVDFVDILLKKWWDLIAILATAWVYFVLARRLDILLTLGLTNFLEVLPVDHLRRIRSDNG
jgi:hypothetical protein